jgi:O-antigen ligase
MSQFLNFQYLQGLAILVPLLVSGYLVFQWARDLVGNRNVYSALAPVILAGVISFKALTMQQQSFVKGQIGFNPNVGSGQTVLILNLIALSFALLAILHTGALKKFDKNNARIFLAYLAFASANIISNFFGPANVFDYKFLILPAFALAGIFSPLTSVQAELFAKYSLRIVMGVSALMVLLQLSQVGMTVFDLFSNIFPSRTYRVNGVAWHANALGPLAALALFIEFRISSKSFYKSFFIVISSALLYATASYTAIVSLLVALLLTSKHDLIRKSNRPIDPNVTSYSSIRARSVLIFAVALVLGQSFFESASTLNGRTDNWNRVIEIWKTSPIFGFGGSVKAFNGQIINITTETQLFQTLGESGLVGAALFLILFFAIYSNAVSAYRLGNTQIFGISLILLINTFTESTFRGEMSTGTLFVCLVMLLISSRSVDLPVDLNKTNENNEQLER